MEKLTECPVCGGKNLADFLVAKDHFLTGQHFTIAECTSCGFRFTNPRPDRNEIVAYYESAEYIAHDAGKGTLFETVYKTVRGYMLDKKLKLVRATSKGNSLLDIGCGTGEFLSHCQKSGYAVTGIEPNDKARNFAKEKYALNIFDEEQLEKFNKESFDVITMWHVMEHVHDLKERIKMVHHLLKPGGTFIIAVPNCLSWDAEYYKEFWAAYDLPRHLYHFTPATMKLLVEKNGFLLTETHPLKFDSFYVSLLSEKYKTGSKSFPRGFLSGLKSNLSAANKEKNYSSMIYITKRAKN
jgi:2-polyprenyl-3-methyl-5-hydroxy-6-metoxy-1,4-benzoquinol methylase